MIERTIIIQKKEQNCVKQLKKRLLSEFKHCKGILTEMEDGSDLYILCAYGFECKEKIDSIIKEEIIQIISSYKKIQYFKRNLQIDKLDKFLYETFIRTLVLYDQKLDIRTIEKKFVLTNYLNLQSFFYFKLPELRHRWNEIINLTNNNVVWGMNKERFEELIFYLLTNLEKKCPELNIIIENNCSKIFVNDNLISQKFIKAKNSQLWLMIKILKYAPKKIKLVNYSTTNNFNQIKKFLVKRLEILPANKL